MEFRLRDRRLYTTLRFEAFFEEFPEMDTWHDMTCLDHTISDAQKRCDMRIIGFDKESRPVLYFCV